MSALIGKHLQHIERLEREIAELRRLEGTPEAPPAVKALIAQKLRTLDLHMQRAYPSPSNVGVCSLNTPGGHSQRKYVDRRQRSSDTPVVPPSLLQAGA